MISNLDTLDGIADTFDDARTFMSENQRKGNRKILITHMSVGLANARCDDPNEHFVGSQSRIQF